MKAQLIGIAMAGLLATQAPAQVDIGIEFVTVGDPGNPPDPFTGDLWGSVPYVYEIGKYEVTNEEYTRFLNSVDPLGANLRGLYVNEMGLTLGGISRDLAMPFGMKYSTKPGKSRFPVNYVSHITAKRFVNWLHGGDTESGVYDSLGSPVRSDSARFWLLSQHEWYKAAYYRGPDSDIRPVFGTDYSLYPMGGFTANNSIPGDTESSNFGTADNVAVGSFLFAASHYGTFDQGGNVREWAEESSALGGSFQTVNGSTQRSDRFSAPGSTESDTGFRIARAVEVQPVAVVPNLDIADAVELKWTSQAGVSYQPQYSTDGASWFDIGSPVEGTGEELRLLQPIGERERLFRVRVNPE